MNDMNDLSQLFAQYGPWAVCAALAIAVRYLFRMYAALEKEMRSTIQTTLRDTLSVVEQTKQVMEQTKQVMEQTASAICQQQITTESLKEIVRLLNSKIK